MTDTNDDFETVHFAPFSADSEEHRWLMATASLPYERRAIQTLERHLRSGLPTSLLDLERMNLETGLKGAVVRDYDGEIGWVVTVGSVSIKVALQEAIEMPMRDLAALVPDRMNAAFAARASA